MTLEEKRKTHADIKWNFPMLSPSICSEKNSKMENQPSISFIFCISVFATLRNLQLFEHQAWQWSRKQLRVFLFSNEVCQPKRVAEYKFKYAESLATSQQLGKKIIHMFLDCMKLEIWTI